MASSVFNKLVQINLETIKARLIEGMTDYIADGDDSYTEVDTKKFD